MTIFPEFHPRRSMPTIGLMTSLTELRARRDNFAVRSLEAVLHRCSPRRPCMSGALGEEVSLVRRSGTSTDVMFEDDLHRILPLRRVGTDRMELGDFVARQSVEAAPVRFDPLVTRSISPPS